MKKVNNNFINVTVFSILFCVFFISIGWSSLNSNLYIDSKALVRIPTNTEITDFNYSSGTTGVLATNNNYTNKTVLSTLYLPLSTSTVTYTVEVTNMQLDTGVTMGIRSITGLPNNMEIVEPMTGYTLKDKICDDIDPTDCGSGSQKTFSFTIRYKENGYDANNLDYNLHLVFEFKEVYDITYSGFTNAPSSPVTVIEGDSPTISLASDAPSVIAVLMGGDRLVQGTDYTFSNYVITFLTTIDDDIIIVKPIVYNIYYVLNDGTQAQNQVTTFTYLDDEEILPATKTGSIFLGWYTDQYFSSNVITHTGQLNSSTTLYAKFDSKAYFMQYTGNTEFFNLINNNFAKTDIKSFSRKTGITKAEAQALSNSNDVSSQTGDYISSNEIYMWAEGASSPYDIYWWSEASEVYWHPNTLYAFEDYSTLVSVDLTGTNTSLVRNFAHWFNNDQILATITGTIVTDGVVDEDDGSFNFSSDDVEGNSSRRGMAFMFNDCKMLTAIDLSGFNTSNVIDMKRMFSNMGASATVITLDLSDFDTSKVKTMYWMFRKTNIRVVDLTYFNTTNVQNMKGMFAGCTAVTTIKFGPNFVDTNLRSTKEMFYGASKLETILAYNNLNSSRITSSSNMFNNNSKLYGAKDTEYELKYSSSLARDKTYARVGTDVNNKGYFTNYDGALFGITYILKNGATANNPTVYSASDLPLTLSAPTRQGFSFRGWTGTNLDDRTLNVTIPIGTEENLAFTAHYYYLYTPKQNLETIFSISGSCTFNGANANITGATCINDDTQEDYTTGKIIDTGINLFNSTNYNKDFEIMLTINSYDPSEQEATQATLLNMKSEAGHYPGLVVRRVNNSIEVKLNINDLVGADSFGTHSRNRILKIVRQNGVLAYSMDNGSYTEVLDFRGEATQDTFVETLIFGSSRDGNGNLMRNIKATVSNISVKLEGD